jgi:hypothetical protein
MANVYTGVGIHWGVGSSGITSFGTFKLQTTDHTKKSKVEEITDGDGNTVGKVYYDLMEEGTFEYIPTGVSSGSITPTLPNVGDKFTVTDTVYTQLAATNWLVDEVNIKRSNTSAMKVSVKCSKYAAIT